MGFYFASIPPSEGGGSPYSPSSLVGSPSVFFDGAISSAFENWEGSGGLLILFAGASLALIKMFGKSA